MVISAEYWSKFQAFGDVSIWVKDSHLLPQETTFFPSRPKDGPT